MRTKLALVLGVITLLAASAAADDYIIQDNNQNNLFVVNQTGEKQIQNGNLFLNGNSIVDNQGDLTLDGGNVEVPNGNFQLTDIGTSPSQLQISRSDDSTSLDIGAGTNGAVYDIVNSGGPHDFRQDGTDVLRLKQSGNIEIPNGNLQMSGNEIQDVSALDLGWKNLTDYPTGCDSDEAVQVIRDTVDCTALEPGGAVNTTGANPGEVGFFINNETITGSSNFFWDNANTELGIGTNTPVSALDVNGQTNLRNTLYMNGNDISNPGTVDGVHLDSPGNAISLDGSNQYQIGSGAIGNNEIGSNAVGTNELADNSVTDAELDSSVSFDMAGLTVTGDAQVRGDLDVWGNISNTDVENLNINGSLLPPSGYDATFNIGSSSRRWQNAYFSGTGKFDSGLTVSSGTVDIPSGEIDNSELANNGFTTSTNSGIDSESVNLGGDLTINHADTSTQGNIDNSGGTIIQDLNFDGYGHVTGQNSYNLDNRYYTETESDSNFVDESGDTMTGSLNMNGSSIYDIYEVESTNSQLLLSSSDTGSRVALYDRYNSEPMLEANIGGNVGIFRTLDMNSNSITNFFGSNCQSDEVVESVNADGTYNCVSITGTADDTYVNEGGDSMTGALNMQGNDVQNVGTLNASVLQQGGNDIDSIYVDESGDSMSGNLNMQTHHIDNLDFLELNSVGDIRVDGTDAIRLDSNQNVEVPNGDIQMSTGNSIDDGSGDDRILMQSDNLRLDTGNSAGSGAVNLYDAANSQDILRANEGGTVQIPNGRISVQDGGSGWAEMYHGGSRDEVYFDTGWGGFTWNTGDGTDAFHVKNGGNVEIPNGNLNVNNQLSVGSTECSTGSYIDGDGSCTSVSGETSGLYVDENGDTMTGNLDMNYNKIDNVGELNVSTSTDKIAHFSDTGVTLSQPLSVESSGPLSVANGIDLTGSSSNTIDSYSTMYLQTSSGSPSDIVLDPTGEVGVDANMSIVGDLDMQGGAISNIGSGGTNFDSNGNLQFASSGTSIFDSGDNSAIDFQNNYFRTQTRMDVESGLRMESNLNVNENQIQNVNALQDGSGTNTINFDGSNGVEIPNGDLQLNGNKIRNALEIKGDVSSGKLTLSTNGGGGNGYVRLWDNANGQPLLKASEGGNVEIPNGNLNVNNQLSVGSTECSTGSYIDGDGSCTSVTGETSGEYVDENGDTMTGDLDMNSNSVLNVGTNNIDIGDGQGNIAMNGQRIVDGGLTQVSGLGVTDTLSTAETEVSGNSIYVQNDVSVDGDFVGAGADVAEKMQNESSMESGTVVKISGNMSVDKTSEIRDKAVAGVVSRDPAMIMAKERDGVPIAMSGTVPVKFSDENGEVKPGDFLTTASKKGHAMKCGDIAKCQGSIIGKAMQPQKETGEVEMMISRG